MITKEGLNFQHTPHGGSGRRLPALWRIKRAPSESRAYGGNHIEIYASEEAIDTGLGREPMPEEIAAEMGMEVDKVRHIIKISQETVSLETPLGIITKIPRWANFRR